MASTDEDREFNGKSKDAWNVQHIDLVFDSNSDRTMFPNPLSQRPNTPLCWFVDGDDAVAADVQVDTEGVSSEGIKIKAEAFPLAGPRLNIAFDPQKSIAAVVTCGGLCPGLNTVVREIVMCLRRQYGVPTIYGIPFGYRGFQDRPSWIKLDEKKVRNFHNMGGSFLGSSRGGHDTNAIVDALVEAGINLLFVTGGDGTLRGAAKIAEEIQSRGIEIAVAVIPKTIDNDIPLIDRTFGFESAVDAARRAIDVAVTEAQGFPLGLGVVKVMGRHSGFIAMHATLGSRVVDLCLVPEVDFYLDGEGGIVDHLANRLLENGNAIVVIAEGAGQDLMATLGSNGVTKRDASGNIILDDVGPWLIQQLEPRLNEKVKGKTPFNDQIKFKYVDPSYMVRGIPPSTNDNNFCTQLAHNAVHGAMAGMTSFLVASVNTRGCYLPIDLIANKQNVIDTSNQSLWSYVIFDTHQPTFTQQDDCQRRSDSRMTASGGVIIG
ncbi:unnamed protein product [Cylindrotheca closterium]|uniref:Phosphofructokinase domain-containing protein n=1 Tax=Cylindrotheca closterium TaxID=2856 RepID=A0AAD2FI98_9STRA|nr:unnamed protein product [Cylindrotheca closterium]